MIKVMLLVKKFPGEKGNVRRCVDMMQQPVPLLPKLGVDLDNPLNVKDNYEHALDFALHLSRLVSVSVTLEFSIGRSCLLPQTLVSSLPGSLSHFF
jgi:hypothetical protein